MPPMRLKLAFSVRVLSPRSTVIPPLPCAEATLKENAPGGPTCGCPSRLNRMRSSASASVAVPTVDRGSAPMRSWSTMIAVVSPSRTSTSGRASVGMKPCRKALYVSLISRCDSAAIVSNTSELLPEPETPVNTVSRRFGSSTLTSLRLFSRAPCTRIRSWLSAGCSAGDCVSVLVAELIVSPSVRRARPPPRARRRSAVYRIDGAGRTGVTPGRGTPAPTPAGSPVSDAEELGPPGAAGALGDAHTELRQLAVEDVRAVARALQPGLHHRGRVGLAEGDVLRPRVVDAGLLGPVEGGQALRAGVREVVAVAHVGAVRPRHRGQRRIGGQGAPPRRRLGLRLDGGHLGPGLGLRLGRRLLDGDGGLRRLDRPGPGRGRRRGHRGRRLGRRRSGRRH